MRRYKGLLEAGAGLCLGFTSGLLTHKHMNGGEAKAFGVFGEQECTGLECPVTKWNPNWDSLSYVKPTSVTRHLIFIRGAQFARQSKEITKVGEAQATMASYRLKMLDLPYNKIRSSNHSGTVVIANRIIKEISLPCEGKKPLTSVFLEEGLPAKVVPEVENYATGDNRAMQASQQRIETGFREIFHRYVPEDSEGKTPDQFEIYVTHHNVIRYFLCRALQFPSEAWLRFSIPHGSITWISINGNGTVEVRCVGEALHLPDLKLVLSMLCNEYAKQCCDKQHLNYSSISTSANDFNPLVEST